MSHSAGKSRRDQQQQELAALNLTPWEAIVPIHANGAAETAATLMGQKQHGSGVGTRTTSATGGLQQQQAHEKYEFFIYTKFTPNLQARDTLIKQEAPDLEEAVQQQHDQQLGARSPQGLANSARKPVPLGGPRSNSLPTAKVQKIKAKANEACISQATLDFVLICLNTMTNDEEEDARAAAGLGNRSSTKKSSHSSRGLEAKRSAIGGIDPLEKGTQSFTLWRVTSSMDNLRRLDMDWSLCARMVEQVFRKGDTSKMTINMSASPASKLVKLDVKLGGAGARIHYPVVELNLSLMESQVANDALVPPPNMDNPILIGGGGNDGKGGAVDEEDVILDPLAGLGGGGGAAALSGPLVDPHRFLFHKLAGLVRRLSRETQDQQDCRRQLDKMKEEIEASKRQYLELEEELMVAFLEVLNTKKQKIKEVTATAQDLSLRNAQLEEENKRLQEELSRRPLLTTVNPAAATDTPASALPSQKKGRQTEGEKSPTDDVPLLREATAADLLEQAEQEEFGDSDRGEDDQPQLFNPDDGVTDAGGLQGGLSSTQMQEELEGGGSTAWAHNQSSKMMNFGDDDDDEGRNGSGGKRVWGLFGPGGIDEYLNPRGATNDALGGRTKRARGDLNDQPGQRGDGNKGSTGKKKKQGGIDLLNMDI